MSRRDGRDSLGKRLHARPEGDPSPKRSKDERTVSERAYSSRSDLTGVKQGRQTKWDQKHAENLQDGLTIVPSPALEKTHAGSISKEVDKANPPVGATHSSPRTDEPRPRSYFQHDERGIAGQGGRSFGHRASERGWRYRPDPKERSNDKVEGSLLPGLDLPERDEKFSDEQKRDKIYHGYNSSNAVSRRDGHHVPEAAAPIARRRPAFRENKLPAKEPSEDAPATAAAEAAAEFARDERRPVSGSAKREERSYQRGQGRPERAFAGVDNRSGRGGDRPTWRGEVHRATYHQPRERFGSGGAAAAASAAERGRERYQERNQSHHPTGNQVEKWKHDLFDEANRSPTPKNEEDQIAKIEALLAS